jgi:phage terminase small subunit
MATNLTDKQQVFINEYLKCWNAAEAARRAGYSDKTARQQGSRLLTNVDISQEIARRLSDMAMSADEALARLSAQAAVNMSDFIKITRGIPFLDLEKAQEADKLHLLKKFKTSERGIEIELFDAQSALVHILKEQHLRSGEATEITNDVGLTDETRASRIAAILERGRSNRAGQSDLVQ